MSDKKETVIAYKGFDQDWKCRDFQFAVGETYTHDGKIKLCSSGFHACEYPLNCFDYYSPAGKFALVELIDPSSETESDTKRVAKSITIKAALSIFDLVSASIEYTTKKCTQADGKHATGYRSASSATGDQSASSATGDQSASSATGDQSASSATGYRSASSATGDQSASSATGYRSASSATGYRSASSATGYRSASSATGYQSASSATGDHSASSATGDQSASSATGYRSASSATGDRSASSATGDQSASSATGDRSASSATGKNSVAMSIGVFGKACAGKDGAIVLCNHDNNGNIRHIRASKVGANGIKPDTFYVLDDNGDFREEK